MTETAVAKKNGRDKDPKVVIAEAIEKDETSSANSLENLVAQAFMQYEGDVKKVMAVHNLNRHQYETIVAKASYQSKYINLVLAYKLWPKVGGLIEKMVSRAMDDEAKDSRHYMKMAMDLMERVQAKDDEKKYPKEELVSMLMNLLSQASNELDMPVEKVIEYLNS